MDRPPPGPQARYERYSVAFFTRPNDAVELRPLSDQSQYIADAAARNPRDEFSTGSTAGEWTARRIRKLRLRNRKVGYFHLWLHPSLAHLMYDPTPQGPETWFEGKGTEHRKETYASEVVTAAA